MASPAPSPALKIKPQTEFIENVESASAVEFGNHNLSILHDEALMVAEGEEKMTGKLFRSLREA